MHTDNTGQRLVQPVRLSRRGWMRLRAGGTRAHRRAAFRLGRSSRRLAARDESPVQGLGAADPNGLYVAMYKGHKNVYLTPAQKPI